MDWLWFVFIAPVAFVGGLMVALLLILAAVGVVMFVGSVVEGFAKPVKPVGDRMMIRTGIERWRGSPP